MYLYSDCSPRSHIPWIDSLRRPLPPPCCSDHNHGQTSYMIAVGLETARVLGKLGHTTCPALAARCGLVSTVPGTRVGVRYPRGYLPTRRTTRGEACAGSALLECLKPTRAPVVVTHVVHTAPSTSVVQTYWKRLESRLGNDSTVWNRDGGPQGAARRRLPPPRGPPCPSLPREGESTIRIPAGGGGP